MQVFVRCVLAENAIYAAERNKAKTFLEDFMLTYAISIRGVCIKWLFTNNSLIEHVYTHAYLSF